MSIDIVNSAEIMVDSHIREEHTFISCRSDLYELLNVAAHVPRKDYHNWNKSPNINDIVNSGANTAGAHFVNQENQTIMIDKINNILLANTMVV